MSSPVINEIECHCCNVAQESNSGVMLNNEFVCFICRKSYKQNKQNGWIAQIQAQKTIIDNAFVALLAVDVLDVENVSVEFGGILNAVGVLQNYSAH